MTQEVENVVLIVVDALRTDRVGAYSGDDLTPNMDSLANEGEVFEQCFSCINATDPSVTSILTGLYPTRHGVIHHGEGVTEEEQRLVAGTTPLPELLKSSHETIGVDILERWHQRGFETYINPHHEKDTPLFQRVGGLIEKLPDSAENLIKSVYSRSANHNNQPTQSELVTDNVINGIRDAGTPFFLFAHYWDVHIPYIPLEKHPEKIQKRTYCGESKPLDKTIDEINQSPWADRLNNHLTGNAESVSDIKQKYDAGVWKVDQAVGRITEELKEEGVYDETAIIITSDHGESFTEHGILFDHHGLYDPTIHVPLIIKAPGFNGRETEFVQHYDIAPTVLDLLEVDYRKQMFDGESLVTNNSRSLERNAIFAEEGHTARKRAIRTDSYKYIKRMDDRELCRYCNIRHAADEELYNVKSDPEEMQNIIEEQSEVKERLDKQLTSWIEQLPDASRGSTTFETSQEVKDHLEEMGYL